MWRVEMEVANLTQDQPQPTGSRKPPPGQFHTDSIPCFQKQKLAEVGKQRDLCQQSRKVKAKPRLMPGVIISEECKGDSQSQAVPDHLCRVPHTLKPQYASATSQGPLILVAIATRVLLKGGL
ncbi:hypothetical protein QWA68_002459 [Fusarium oxysporum]|nr:hypothetical protein QWA68_002459 [Fusarium oxysporum]